MVASLPPGDLADIRPTLLDEALLAISEFAIEVGKLPDVDQVLAWAGIPVVILDLERAPEINIGGAGNDLLDFTGPD